ncbi:hypothetical protein Bca4012_008701 [Brassica carinata]|uniref:Uncharacterized protein n=1 Tax=Brassica carinata TaxID=52824 RepID=A0A8X7PYH0_BRACI|nr:hypothetical protein Bca52824_079998 [Brassica carinata]
MVEVQSWTKWRLSNPSPSSLPTNSRRHPRNISSLPTNNGRLVWLEHRSYPEQIPPLILWLSLPTYSSALINIADIVLRQYILSRRQFLKILSLFAIFCLSVSCAETLRCVTFPSLSTKQSEPPRRCSPPSSLSSLPVKQSPLRSVFGYSSRRLWYRFSF